MFVVLHVESPSVVQVVFQPFYFRIVKISSAGGEEGAGLGYLGGVVRGEDTITINCRRLTWRVEVTTCSVKTTFKGQDQKFKLQYRVPGTGIY